MSLKEATPGIVPVHFQIAQKTPGRRKLAYTVRGALNPVDSNNGAFDILHLRTAVQRHRTGVDQHLA